MRKQKSSVPVWAEIDLDRLRNNLRAINEQLRSTVKIMAVVKGNAYGHGAPEIATLLEEEGIEFFAVANVDEGVQLRRSGISGSILVLEAVLPEQAQCVVEHDLTPTVYDFEIAELLGAKSEKNKKRIKYHLRIDSGSGGLGILPREFYAFIHGLRRFKRLELEGVYTHLTSDYRGDDDAVRSQIATFNQLLDNLQTWGLSVPYIHVASSLAILNLPEAHFNMVRPGILLYGIPPAKEFRLKTIKPIMQLKSRIIALKNLEVGEHIGTYHTKIVAAQPMKYAVIPIGYADAFYLLTTSKGFVLIKGKRAPIIGQARMNQTLVDVSRIPEAAIGDEVVIIGEQGDARITAEAATLAAGIPVMNCESVCLIASRVPRVYLQEDSIRTTGSAGLKQHLMTGIEGGRNG